MKVAIVGAEIHTREFAPWDDPGFDIWVFNEWANAEWCKRFTAVLQIHKSEKYRSPTSTRDPLHWEWLQEERGIPIYMQDVDPDVPDSVRYPLEEINIEYMSWLTWNDEPVKNFTSTISYAVALALYEGYTQIDIYGVELSHSSEYHSQQPTFAFWVGVAAGRKVKVNLHCSKNLFDKPLYGREELMETHELQNYIDGLTTQMGQAEANLKQAEAEFNQVVGALNLAKQMLEPPKEIEENGIQKQKQEKSKGNKNTGKPQGV